ncbi:MAG: tetratricopeptide repeat protein [Spirochaetaceae bacterium]|nr:tetratricopeptide repeat protein [Spirochaetaceae bacterium]
MKKVLFIILIFAICFPVFSEERPDALQMFREGRYEEAVRICREELETMPRNLDSFTVLGWSLIRLGRYQEALNYGQAALRISRFDTRVIQNMGEAHFYLGNNQEALRFFEEFLSLVETGARVAVTYFYMGEIFIRLREFNRADIALTTAVHYSPNNARWWTRLGYARERAEDFNWALEAYDRALRISPTHAEAMRGRSRVQLRLAT